MDIKKTIEKLEEYNAYKRSQDPFYIELNRLMNEVYPYEKLNDIFKFGQLNMLVFFKNEVYKYFNKDGQDYIDAIVESYMRDTESKRMLDKLIKKDDSHKVGWHQSF